MIKTSCNCFIYACVLFATGFLTHNIIYIKIMIPINNTFDFNSFNYYKSKVKILMHPSFLTF